MTTDRHNAIIALWAHPRSMSTAMERIMRERGDLCCLHEPFMYYYYVELGRKHMPHSSLDPARPTAFADIVTGLRDASGHRPVFFKDMAYYVIPRIFDHPELASDLRHIFLIRDPRRAILSYHRLDPGLLQEEVGIEAQWRLYKWLRENTDNPIPVIRAETVQQDPVSAMKQVWDLLDLPFCADAFNWDENHIPEEWKTVAGWHGDVAASTAIRATSSGSDKQVRTEFEQEAARAPVLKALLDHHLPFYQKLVEESLVPR